MTAHSSVATVTMSDTVYTELLADFCLLQELHVHRIQCTYVLDHECLQVFTVSSSRSRPAVSSDIYGIC